MGCASSVPSSEKQDAIVVSIDGLDEHIVNDESAPHGIKACTLWGEHLIQDLSDDASTTGFGFIDRIFAQASAAISEGSLTINITGVLRERIMAIGAGVEAGAPVLEVGIVRGLPVVSVVSLAGEKKRVLATVSSDGGKGIADVSLVIDALKAATAKASKAGSLTFKVTAACWVSLGGHEGKLESPPVSVMESKDGRDLGMVSVADLKERRRKRLVAKGVLQEDDPLDDDDDDDLDEEEIGEVAEKAAAEAEEVVERRPGSTSMSEKIAAKAAAATAAAAAAAAGAKEKASALAEKASKYKSFYSDPEEVRLFYRDLPMMNSPCAPHEPPVIAP
jgi:hypothetical protein